MFWYTTTTTLFNFILAGIGVILFYYDYSSISATGNNQLIGAILAIASGIAMLMDSLHNLEYF